MTTGTIAKQELLALLEELPDEVDVEELLYRLFLRERLAVADREIAQGRTLTEPDVQARINSWRK